MKTRTSILRPTFLLPLLFFASCATVPHEAPAQRDESVILLHGLARTSRSMSRMQKALEDDGYHVCTVAYPTRKLTVEELSAQHLHPAVLACQKDAPRQVHFVVHSLGGIVLRYYLSEREIPNLGRIVMLGTPNKGSEVVDRIGHMKLFQKINGPAGNQLGTGPDSLPNRLPEPNTEVGIVAGTRSINWILSGYIPGKDDGKVSPESAKLESMTDFTTVETSHPFLMRDPEVIELTKRFLVNGRFSP